MRGWLAIRLHMYVLRRLGKSPGGNFLLYRIHFLLEGINHLVDHFLVVDETTILTRDADYRVKVFVLLRYVGFQRFGVYLTGCFQNRDLLDDILQLADVAGASLVRETGGIL